MLDALTVVGAQIFLDLPAPARAFLVERDTNLAVGRGHRLAGQPGVFALDVEIADLAEPRDALVERSPVRHPPAVDVVSQMIDHLTHNVYGGRMAHWASFYERIAGFREIRFFDIKGNIPASPARR